MLNKVFKLTVDNVLNFYSLEFYKARKIKV